MQLSTALSLVNSNNVTEFQNLAEILSPEIISAGLKEHGISTIRKRKLPMENMVWAVIGMALFRKFPMRQMLNQLDIILPSGIPYVASSAVTQARKKLGSKVIETVFQQTQQQWNHDANHGQWCGLNLLGVDGVV